MVGLEASDWNVSPTRWQWSQLPEFGRARTSIIHDGVDTTAVRPNPQASITLGRAGICRPGDEIVTFINRNLEPYRGYHMFMRALPEILRRRPKARAVIVAATRSVTARRRRRALVEGHLSGEVADKLDMSRVHLVGKVPYPTYLNLLQVSAAHVYLTYPFVLSWSMLESMAAECLVIGSRTKPVEEVIEHGKNGLLVDFFSPEAIAAAAVEALANPKAYREMRRAARRTVVERYDLASICLPAHLQLVRDVAEGRTPVSGTSKSVRPGKGFLPRAYRYPRRLLRSGRPDREHAARRDHARRGQPEPEDQRRQACLLGRASTSRRTAMG